MGNLICCYGEDHQKRGGTSVKTMLRKTEKPGKRRKRIDDLVVDALKREKRDERLNKKKEKREEKSIKEHEWSTESITADKKLEDKTYDDDKSKESNSVNDEQSVNTSELNDRWQTISGRDGTRLSYHKSDTGLKTDESCEVQDNSYNGFQEHCKGSLNDQFNINNGTDCNVNELGNPFDSTAIDENTDNESDSKKLNIDSKEEAVDEKDSETNFALDDVVSHKTREDSELTQRQEIDIVSENDSKESENDLICEHETKEENGNKKDDLGKTGVTAEKLENGLTEATERQNDENVDAVEKPTINTFTDNVLYPDKENFSNNIEINEDRQKETDETIEVGLQSETCGLDENSLDIPGVHINGDDKIANSITKYEEDKPRYDNNENVYEDNETVDLLKVHDDTDSTSRGKDNTEMIDNKTYNVLKVHGIDNLTGYDDTELTHYRYDDYESIDDDLALEPIPRSQSLPLKRWGSSNDLSADTRTTKRKHADTRKDINSFKKHLNNLKQIYSLSKIRGQELKNHLKRTTAKRPAVLRYSVMNLALYGGQKPQIKEIMRLKKDPFNFPAKIRQFTERDRYGSIEDLKWSRHMRAEVRRHISMESEEFDELMCLTGREQNEDSEFDVCDEPRSPTPIPDVDTPRSPTPVPGCDNLYTHGPVPRHDSPRSLSPDLRYDPRQTRTSKLRETMKKLRERYGTDQLPNTRHKTPNRLTQCSRHSKPFTTNYRLNTSGDRKKAAFQTIIRQFEKSFKDAEARRPQEPKGHSRNNTSCVGIGRQNSFMNLGDGA